MILNSGFNSLVSYGDVSVAPGVCSIFFFFFFFFFCTDMICRFPKANLFLHMFRGVSETIQGNFASD